MRQEVLISLSKDIDELSKILESRPLTIVYYGEDVAWSWDHLQRESREEYLRIEKSLRDLADEFFLGLRKYYSSAIHFLSETLPKILTESDRFGFLAAEPKTQVRVWYKLGSGREVMRAGDLERYLAGCLVDDNDPADQTRIEIVQSGHQLSGPTMMNDLVELWSACLRRIHENESYLNLKSQETKLRDVAKLIHKQIDALMDKNTID